MNIPNLGSKQEVPDEAQGNPVYEQTRQDMPLWCCGRNCGRNTRIVCAILALIGIGCSLWACLSVNYFSFVALRNDTFFDPEKAFPAPFEYATEANVGLFKYEILDVFEYPWPPERERALADEMLLDELRRMQEVAATAATTLNITEAPTASPSAGPTAQPTKAPTASPTKIPTANPTVNLDDCEGVDSIEPGPGSIACGVTPSPTTTPTMAPTITNPNDRIKEEVQIGVVQTYENGVGQFDSTFTNAQRGAIFGPVFAFVGTVFSMIEVCFCTYKCSWLPSALFLYLAFMFQLFTLFLFLSEDWCKYDQDCALGNAGYGSAIAVVCYMIAQSLMCCSPRPTPIFNMCKKKTPKRKKKKKQPGDDGENNGLASDFDDPYSDQPESFRDEDGYADPYDDAGDYDDYGSSYVDQDEDGSDLYSSAYGNDSYYTEDDDAGESYYTEDNDDYDQPRY